MASLRKLALEVLDDEYGITTDAWHILYALLEEKGEHKDIAKALDGCEGRVYLSQTHGLQ